MTETTAIEQAVRDVSEGFQPHDSRPADQLDTAAWSAFEDLGFTSVTVPEPLGGGSGTLPDAAAVVSSSAGVRAPVAESNFLAGPVLRAGNERWPGGTITAAAAPAATTHRDGRVDRVSGTAERVPWARHARWLVVVIQDGHRAVLVRRDSPGVGVEHGHNIAGEPRDQVVLDSAPLAGNWELPAEQDWPEYFGLLGATARVAQLAGASRRVLELTVRHASERVQFGRPLVKFQAVQHQIARLAADVASMETARDYAAEALEDDPAAAWFAVASAKSEASALAGRVASVSHQVHGAIGFTMEHRLGAYSKRLWSWREEFGSDACWQQRLGRTFAASGTDLWDFATVATRTGQPHPG